MYVTWFGAFIAVWILVAFAVGILARKIGFALVMLAFAAMWIWDKYVNGWEWIIFLLVALPIGLYTLLRSFRGRRFRPRTRARAGAIVFILAIVLSTPFNFGDVFKAPIVAAVQADRPALLAEMEAKVKGDYDSAKHRLDAMQVEIDRLKNDMYGEDGKIADLTKRVAELEKKYGELNGEIADLEKKVKGTVTTALPTDMTRDQIAKAISADLVDQGINPKDVTFFTINWDENIYDVGDNPFTDRMIDSQWKLRRHLNDGSDRGKANRAHVLAALPKAEERRALSGVGYIPMQFHTKTCLVGNTYYDRKTKLAIPNNGVRCHEAGDVIWVYVGSDGKVYWDASIRADCGNSGMSRPPRPDQPKPTPTSTSTSSTSTSTTPTSTSTSTTPTSTSTSSTSTSTTPSSSKTSAPPPPDQSPRPTGTSTASPSASPTHTGSTLGPTSTSTTYRSPTATGTVGDG